ncbi:peptidylprolyl isomerase [Thiomicrorhabdus sp.]|uniref:peptidylprolyl isomerase n=1 Tax=Thiomicrorhabdus sp. TaxID=2039724 RepID=UPI0029C920AB|nr:peptidylprolyl isomerase [Thiomicrorhabdus sp.]
MKRRLFLSLFSGLLALTFLNPSWAESNAKNPQVLLETSKGTILLELYPDKAPKTVKNFLEYVNEGFYDGTIFHRVIPNFMIQGGGFTPGLQKKPTHDPIMNEADNGLRNRIGTIAMARTNDPHSASAQFFINVAQNSFLDYREKTSRAWGYAVFGRVIKGMKTVNKIRVEKTGYRNGMGDVPVETVKIIKARQVQ